MSWAEVFFGELGRGNLIWVEYNSSSLRWAEVFLDELGKSHLL